MSSLGQSFSDYKIKIKKWLETKDNLLIYFIFFGIAGFLITYTSNSELYLSWTVEIKNFDYSGFKIIGNPVWFFYIVICTWIQFYSETLLPFVFGSNNVFLLRFLFKIPIFLTFFISVHLIVNVYRKNQEINLNKVFTLIFILILLPLFYIAFIWGSPSIIGLFFFLLYINRLHEKESNKFIQGILIGFSISFSISFLILYLPFILEKFRSKQRNELRDEISGSIVIWIIILIPYIVWNGKYLFNLGNINIGTLVWIEILKDIPSLNISILLALFGLLIVCTLLLLGLIGLKRKFPLVNRSTFKVKFNLSIYFFLIFFPILTIENSVILMFFIFINLLRKLLFDNENNKEEDIIQVRNYKKSFKLIFRIIFFVIAVSFILLMLFISLPINSVFHIDIIRISSFATYQQSISDINRKIISIFLFYCSVIVLEILDVIFLFRK